MKFGELLSVGPGDKDPKEENPFGKEMRILAKRNLPYDNRNSLDLARDAAKFSGINPALLLSSSFQEGMNKAIARPDEVSEAYVNANVGADYPVDAFYNYGIDQFDKYLPNIKQYLPEGFDQKYKIYQAKNEKGEPINTAAFKDNQSALMVKAAILKNNADLMDKYATSKGVTLDDNARNYFTLASYNAGEANAMKMFDKYLLAKDKTSFIEKGDENWQKVHKNISPRMSNISIANELLNPPVVELVLPQIQPQQ